MAYPADTAIEVILDNHSAHVSRETTNWLAAQPLGRFTFARHPDVPIIAFPRGAGLLYQGYAEATGADAIGLDSAVPLQWAAEMVQQGLGRCVQGNLDPQMLVIGGPRMFDEAMRILNSLSAGPFVFNLGHGIAQHTPPEYVGALVQQVRSWHSI